MVRPIDEMPAQRSLSRRILPSALIGLIVVASALGAACGATRGSSSSVGGSGGLGTGGEHGQGGTGGDLLTTVGSVGSGMTSNLIITPSSPTLKIDLPLPAMIPTVSFKCLDASSMQPVGNAIWSLDKGSLGLIDKGGVFTPSGNGAGQVKVTCTSGKDTTSTVLSILMHAVDNGGGVTPTDIAALQAPGGSPDGSWAWLYPYDNTVLPRAILPPQIHLTPGSATGQIPFYVHIKSPSYEYEGFFLANASNTQLEMTQAAWDALTLSDGGTTVQVDVAKLFNGVKYGPVSRSWILAPGRLHGVIYYNSYDSMVSGQTGAMLRIKGTSTVPDVLVGNCTVCHSVSKDGSTAAAANHNGGGGIFDLSSGMLNPPLIASDPELYSFAGIYPMGGQFVVTNAAPGGSWPPNTPGTSVGPYTSSLHTRMGGLIPSSGIESYYAQSPMFSPDGKTLAFYDRQPGGGDTAGTLALMDFDPNTTKFTNYRKLATPPTQSEHYSWPDFTPDSKYVFYQDGTGGDLATWASNTGKIQCVNTANGAVTYPKLLNGDGIVNQPGRDENVNFEPTMMPIASGGYFWLMFTSRRTYGNVLTGSRDQTKRLWVSAVDINITDGKDMSHPPFYIRGQELNSGNSRGFWTLDACKPMGGDCMTADDCCDGYCYAQNDGTMKCSPPEQMCAPEFGNCMTAADCCDPNDECIGGKCSFVPPK